MGAESPRKEKAYETVADAKHAYILQYQPNVFATDRICMGVSSDSPLQFVEAAVKDETGNIVVALAKFAGRLGGPGAFTPSIPAPGVIKGREVRLKIEPLDALDQQSVERAIDMNFPRLGGRISFRTKDAEQFTFKGKQNCPNNSVCYRTLVPVRMTLRDKHTGQFTFAHADVANRAATHRIDVTRAFLVEKITKLGVDNRILTSAVVRKPSEALATAQLPLTVYDSLLTSALAAPGNFVGTVTGSNAQEKLAEQLRLQAKTLGELVTIQSDLRKLREDSETPVADAADQAFRITCTPNPED